MEIKTVGVACDHAGYPLKQFVIQYLEEHKYAYKDFGCNSDLSCDYPDYAHPLAEAIESGEVYPGIAICGSGEGMAIALNKHQGVRAGLVWNKDVAELTRQHNDANVAVLPGRFIDNKTAEKILDAFFKASFEGVFRGFWTPFFLRSSGFWNDKVCHLCLGFEVMSHGGTERTENY